MRHHNRGQIIDALRRSNNNPNVAIAFLASLPKPPNIKENPTAWFRYFDPTNSGGLTKEEIIDALHLSFGSDLRTGTVLKYVIVSPTGRLLHFLSSSFLSMRSVYLISDLNLCSKF